MAAAASSSMTHLYCTPLIVGCSSLPFSRRQSLALKIPLLLSLLLLAALTAMSVASYIELRRALMEMATTRLQQAADQTAAVFAMTARQRIAAMKQLMDRKDVREYLTT